MDKNFCRQIDKESLVEQYVAGKLRGDLLDQFEQHLKNCENHARAVLLEKALKRGVSDFARGEIKSKLRDRLKKREDTRFMILRYAAILLVAVITPLLLYYQLNIAPREMADSVSEREESVISDDEIDRYDEDQSKEEEPLKTELNARSSKPGVNVVRPVKPAALGGTTNKKSEESTDELEQARRVEIDNKQRMKSQDMQDMLKAVKTSPPPKIEDQYPLEEESDALEDQAPAIAIQGFSKGDQSTALVYEINRKVEEDSVSIRECIEDFLDDKARQNFEIELNIQVLNDGNIGEIKIRNTTYQSDDLESCLFSIIKAWALPVETGEGMVLQKITY